MIIEVLLIVPPPVRPSVMFDSINRSEDDLTFQYVQIIKTNNALKKQIEKGAA